MKTKFFIFTILLALAPTFLCPSARTVRAKRQLCPAHMLVGRCCRNALILLLLLAAAALRAQPVITTPPQSLTVRVGESAGFNVIATGTPPLTYQWCKDGADLAGATNADYSLPQTRAADAGRYTVTVSNATGRVTSDAATLTVQYVVQFSAAGFSVSETGRVAVIRVRRGDDGPGTVTVNYATSDGTATAGQDYTATSGTLSFGPGETEKGFTIPILDDALPEGVEYVRLALSGLTGPAEFGVNSSAQLAIIDDERSSVASTGPRPVIAVGSGHTVALKVDGGLWTWGDNYAGQLGVGMDPGSGTNAPVSIGADHDWATVATGASHTLAVKADGSLWAWGANSSGQLGTGADVGTATNVPARVGTDADWVMVAAGDYHSLGLKLDGSLWAWGAVVATNVPVRVGADNDWAWVNAGWNLTVVLKADGSLWSWGDILSGQLCADAGMEHDWEIAVIAGGSDGWSSTDDSVALKSDGTLWAWGRNDYGQLGDGTTSSRSAPTRIGSDDDWTAIAAAYRHTLAVKSDGRLWAWGENSSGKLGLGVDFGPSQLEPTQVGADYDWAAIAAGRSYSIGLKIDGSLWAWGSGRLGLGGEFNQNVNVPTRIGSDNDWAQPVAPPVRGEFRITAQSFNVDHSRTLFFTHTNSHSYYVLYRGDSLTNITQPVDAALARAYPSLTDRTPPATSATAFYRIRAVPRTQPLDLDHDGIDDYYELRHAAFLHPLNSADAAQDYDGDGYSNLSEYRAGTDPGRLTVRHSIASGLAHTVVLKQDGSLWAWGQSFPGVNTGIMVTNYIDEPVRIGTNNDWISVAVRRDIYGGDSTLALKRDGSLWEWLDLFGTNPPSRLTGNSWMDVSAGGVNWVALPRDGSLWVNGQRIGTDKDWVTVTAGGQHILALKADRSLWAWGNNDFGQCGLGDGVFTVDTPTRIGTDNDWIAIAASGDGDSFDGTHSLGLKADGTLWSWGYDQAGELGLGNPGTFQFTPDRVGTETNWVAIAVGSGTSLARKRDGTLWMWGNGIGSVPTLANMRHDWRDFAAGGAAQSFPNFATAIAADGSMWTWRFGPPVSRVPVSVGAETNWAAVTAGAFHSLALKLDRTLWSWGGNYYGQLGDETFLPRATPSRIASNTTWRIVSAGWHHTVALRGDGTLWTWGWNANGQLGIGTFTTNAHLGITAPQPVATNATWQSAAAGGGHTAALNEDGSLWTWGGGGGGGLGNGMFTTNAPYGIASPFPVVSAATWSAVAAGAGHTFGLSSDGSLWACGHNYYGQLGLGFVTTNAPFGISIFQRVPTNVMWRSISAGGSHTVALSTDGKLWAWGWNGYGQLGNGSFTDASSPQSIAPEKTWKAAIAAGGPHTVALGSDGTLWTWGANYLGQLGIGTLDNSRNTPQPVQPNTAWKAIGAGGNHTLAIREDGTLWSWGDNTFGQLGIPPDLTPTRLGPDTDWGSPP